MVRSWLSAQWQILGVSSHFIVGYSHYLPNGGYFGMSGRGMIICLPNGRFQLAAYWLSVMSSMVKLSQSSTPIAACCPWWRKHGQHLRVLE